MADEHQQAQQVAQEDVEDAQQVAQEAVEDIRYRRGRDRPSDVRSIILTVAVLLASATYQAAFKPPGGIWSEDGPTSDIVAGVSVFGTKHPNVFYCFVFGNTTVFLFSLAVIYDLTHKFTRMLELRIALPTLLATYCFCVFTVSPGGFPTWLPLFISGVSAVLVVAVRMARVKWCPNL